MSNKARNEQLAAELLSQVEELVDDFIRDNLDTCLGRPYEAVQGDDQGLAGPSGQSRLCPVR